MVNSSNGYFLVKPLPKNVMLMVNPTPYDMYNYVTNALVLQDCGVLQKGDIVQFHNKLMHAVAEHRLHFTGNEIGIEDGYYWLLHYEPNPYAGIYGYFRGLNCTTSTTLHGLNHQKLMSHFHLFDDILLIDREKDLEATAKFRQEIRAKVAKDSLVDSNGLPITRTNNKEMNALLAKQYIYQTCGKIICAAENLNNKYVGDRVLLAPYTQNLEKIGDVLYNTVFEEDVVGVI